jgi:type IV secretion system protein VirD4
MHVVKTGCRWEDCPPEYGPRKTIYNRFNRWSGRGIWQSIYEAVAKSPEPPEQLANYGFVPGQIILGKFAGQFLGHLDDRPLVTIASARAGKTSTILEPNLYLYPGSMLVLDPKGELSRTAGLRRGLNCDVHILDPFGQSGERSACFNALAELDPKSWTTADDVASMTHALIVDDDDARSRHWNDCARALVKGIILLTLTFAESERISSPSANCFS